MTSPNEDPDHYLPFPLYLSSEGDSGLASYQILPSNPYGIQENAGQQYELPSQSPAQQVNNTADREEGDREHRVEHGGLFPNSPHEFGDNAAGIDEFMSLHLSMDAERISGRPHSMASPDQAPTTGLQHINIGNPPFGRPLETSGVLDSHTPLARDQFNFGEYGDMRLPERPTAAVLRGFDFNNTGVEEQQQNAPLRQLPGTNTMVTSPALPGQDHNFGQESVRLGCGQRQEHALDSSPGNITGTSRFDNLHTPPLLGSNGRNVTLSHMAAPDPFIDAPPSEARDLPAGPLNNFSGPSRPQHLPARPGVAYPPSQNRIRFPSDDFHFHPSGRFEGAAHDSDGAFGHHHNFIGPPRPPNLLAHSAISYTSPMGARDSFKGPESSDNDSASHSLIPSSPPLQARVESPTPVNILHDRLFEAMYTDQHEDSGSDWEESSKMPKRKRTAKGSDTTPNSKAVTAKSTPSSGSTSSARRVRAPRNRLFQWTPDEWKQVVLAFVRTLHQQGIKIPFEQVAREFNQGCSANALRQAISKMQFKLVASGIPLPPLHMNWSDSPAGHRKTKSQSTQVGMQKFRVSSRNLAALARRPPGYSGPPTFTNRNSDEDNGEGSSDRPRRRRQANLDENPESSAPRSLMTRTSNRDDLSSTLPPSLLSMGPLRRRRSPSPPPPPPRHYRPTPPANLPPWDGSIHWPGMPSTMRLPSPAYTRIRCPPILLEPHRPNEPQQPLTQPTSGNQGVANFDDNTNATFGSFAGSVFPMDIEDFHAPQANIGAFHDPGMPFPGFLGGLPGSGVDHFAGFGGDMGGSPGAAHVGSGELAPLQNPGQEQEEVKEEEAAEGDAFPFGDADPSRHAF